MSPRIHGKSARGSFLRDLGRKAGHFTGIRIGEREIRCWNTISIRPLEVAGHPALTAIIQFLGIIGGTWAALTSHRMGETFEASVFAGIQGWFWLLRHGLLDLIHEAIYGW